MSQQQQTKMSNQAATMTQSDQERKTRKLLERTDCPLVGVYSASGAPGTEPSWTCQFYAPDSIAMRHRGPECNSYGKCGSCPLVKFLRQRGELDIAAKVLYFQRNRKMYTMKIEGSIGTWILRP